MKGIAWSPWFLVLILVALVLSTFAVITPGPTGPQGLPGSIGVQGLPGPPGTDGTDGRDGIDGDRGLQGSQGVQGPVGLQGVQGAQGVQGIPGDTGQPGEVLREVPHLASLAVSKQKVDRGKEIEVWGADFHHEPELRLYDSEGRWFVLGRAKVEWHKFAMVIYIPDDAAPGVAEIVALTEGNRAAYHTVPIMIRD